jgi:hypothetical protein
MEKVDQNPYIQESSMILINRRIDNYYGYVWVRVKLHGAIRAVWIKEHHFLWSKKHGRKVPDGFVLHHKDHNKENNRLSNLVLMSRAEHARTHHVGRKISLLVRRKMSRSAKARCTPVWRKAVSQRVKLQHKQGRFGRRIRNEHKDSTSS